MDCSTEKIALRRGGEPQEIQADMLCFQASLTPAHLLEFGRCAAFALKQKERERKFIRHLLH
jgi:hypothetical protein